VVVFVVVLDFDGALSALCLITVAPAFAGICLMDILAVSRIFDLNDSQWLLLLGIALCDLSVSI